MIRKAFLLPLLSVMVLASLLLMVVQPAAAAAGDPVELTGAVTSIDELGGSFVLTTADSQVFTVFPPLGFDLTALTVSDLVEVVGTFNDDGSVAASEIKPLVQVEGSVVSVDPAARSFVIQTAAGELVTIMAPETFDLAGLFAGDIAAVTGTANEDGSVAAITIIVTVKITGTVASLDPLAGSFTVETGTGEVYNVLPPAGFDWTGLSQGDQVEVTGMRNEDGSVQADSILVQPGEGDEQNNEGYYCTQSDVQHPVGAFLAEGYQVDYAILQAWFCQGYGWGEIVLALQTAKVAGADPSALLAAHGEGSGWGQIWRELGHKGKPKDGDSAASGEGSDQPDSGDLESSSDHPGNSGNPHDSGGGEQPGHQGNPNDPDSHGHPDRGNSHKPDKHNP